MASLPFALLSAIVVLHSLPPAPAAAATADSGAAELYARFQTPSFETRPFARWWWNGGRVREAELIRQLDLMHAAGIGGVEINTIGMPVVSVETNLTEHPEVPWLSEEWCRLIRVTAEAARQRGMVADLLVGSGWPLGGKFLRVEQQTQRVRVERQVVRGPATLQLTREELVRQNPNQRKKTSDEVEPARTELLFLRLLSIGATAGEFQPGDELLTTLHPESVVVTVPAGEYELYIGLHEWGFTEVKHGAPGADGPVMDHFAAEPVRAYLDYMTAGLAPVLGGRLGNHLRALFVDSIELDHANWTGDVPEQFRSRRGYDLLPYLPYVLMPDDPALDSPFQHTVRQARFDFNRTLVELFQERFLGTFAEFCREQGVLSRVQAYGRETHPLHGSMLVDLPEGETWLWHDRSSTRGALQMDSTVINKFVSSAAHLTGRKVLSFEAMTSAVTPFRESLADFKHALDLTFLDGLNHPIIHGFNYSPREAGLPGWVRFGSYLNEHNPWWPAFHAFSDYAARIGTLLRHTTARAEVAILSPRADEWGRFDRLYQPFPEVRHPWYNYDMARAIQHAGNGSDFISEEVLQQAVVQHDRLTFGPQSYAVVILAEVDSVAPATLRALVEFARQGGRVIALGQLPSRSAGLSPQRSGREDQVVQELARELRQLATVQVVPPPAYVETTDDPLPPSHRKIGHGDPLPDASYAVMIPWVRQLLDQAGIEPNVAISPLSAVLSQVNYATAETDVYFLANRSRDHGINATLTFPPGRGALWRWDPETGERAPVRAPPAGGLPLALAPQESVVLVFDRTSSPKQSRPEIDVSEGAALPPAQQTLTGPWLVELEPAGDEPIQQMELASLADLSELPQSKDFGGVAHYRLVFSATESAAVHSIDLGTVYGLSEVSLNGASLGRRWYGRHHYAVGDALRPGRNELMVTVRTHLANLVRAKRHDPSAQRWAFWYDPTPAGLVGPVTLRGR
jgi:hypothetical protein